MMALSEPAAAAKLFWEWHQAPCDRTWADGHVGNRPADLCKLSMVLSPYHLAYPIVFYSVEVRLFAWLGTAFDSGLGTYKGGAVTQFGIRVPFYPAGDFDGGLQVGPFVRAAFLRLPDATSTEPPSTRHAVGSAVYNDVEFARSNGRNAIYPGILIGGKYIAGAKGTEFSSVRGLTLQGGFLVGYHALVGSPRHEPHALATRTESGFLPQLYLEAGYSL
ncbi:MAG: hypothetical protein IT375_17430 [Polyangiaceae bacterium]|nr:hypothetical protein [Polyangiaceae bacterium]